MFVWGGGGGILCLRLKIAQRYKQMVQFLSDVQSILMKLTLYQQPQLYLQFYFLHVSSNNLTMCIGYLYKSK